MQTYVDGVTVKVPPEFVKELEKIEDIVTPGDGADNEARTHPAAIAKAVMKHYGQCGICNATVGGNPLALFVPFYEDDDGGWGKRSVDWYINGCKARGTMEEGIDEFFEYVRAVEF